MHTKYDDTENGSKQGRCTSWNSSTIWIMNMAHAMTPLLFLTQNTVCPDCNRLLFQFFLCFGARRTRSTNSSNVWQPNPANSLPASTSASLYPLGSLRPISRRTTFDLCWISVGIHEFYLRQDLTPSGVYLHEHRKFVRSNLLMLFQFRFHRGLLREMFERTLIATEELHMPSEMAFKLAQIKFSNFLMYWQKLMPWDECVTFLLNAFYPKCFLRAINWSNMPQIRMQQTSMHQPNLKWDRMLHVFVRKAKHPPPRKKHTHTQITLTND